jgi:predicted metalloprotease with PDZ domain
MELEQKDTGSLNAMYSIGLELGDHGMIADVRWGSAADAAGLAPGMLVVDVGGKSFSVSVHPGIHPVSLRSGRSVH